MKLKLSAISFLALTWGLAHAVLSGPPITDSQTGTEQDPAQGLDAVTVLPAALAPVPNTCRDMVEYNPESDPIGYLLAPTTNDTTMIQTMKIIMGRPQYQIIDELKSQLNARITASEYDLVYLCWRLQRLIGCYRMDGWREVAIDFVKFLVKDCNIESVAATMIGYGLSRNLHGGRKFLQLLDYLKPHYDRSIFSRIPEQCLGLQRHIDKLMDPYTDISTARDAMLILMRRPAFPSSSSSSVVPFLSPFLVNLLEKSILVDQRVGLCERLHHRIFYDSCDVARDFVKFLAVDCGFQWVATIMLRHGLHWKIDCHGQLLELFGGSDLESSLQALESDGKLPNEVCAICDKSNYHSNGDEFNPDSDGDESNSDSDGDESSSDSDGGESNSDSDDNECNPLDALKQQLSLYLADSHSHGSTQKLQLRVLKLHMGRYLCDLGHHQDKSLLEKLRNLSRKLHAVCSMDDFGLQQCQGDFLKAQLCDLHLQMRDVCESMDGRGHGCGSQDEQKLRDLHDSSEDSDSEDHHLEQRLREHFSPIICWHFSVNENDFAVIFDNPELLALLPRAGITIDIAPTFYQEMSTEEFHRTALYLNPLYLEALFPDLVNLGRSDLAAELLRVRSFLHWMLSWENENFLFLACHLAQHFNADDLLRALLGLIRHKRDSVLSGLRELEKSYFLCFLNDQGWSRRKLISDACMTTQKEKYLQRLINERERSDGSFEVDRYYGDSSYQRLLESANGAKMLSMLQGSRLDYFGFDTSRMYAMYAKYPAPTYL